MMSIPQFVLNKSVLPDLTTALQKASLDVQQVDSPKTTAEGIEQVWVCYDKSGQLFSFSTFEANAGNIFGLKAGEVCLVLGPSKRRSLKRTRKEIVQAFERFESA